MTRLRYSVLLGPDVDGGFTVTVPEPPGVVTEGDSEEEALIMAREAISPHLAGLVADGEAIPVGYSRPRLAVVEVDVPAAHAVS